MEQRRPITIPELTPEQIRSRAAEHEREKEVKRAARAAAATEAAAKKSRNKKALVVLVLLAAVVAYVAVKYLDLS
ncbi:MAG: hypothetical protein Q8O46_00595 [bacterium]|nr:hypothetical protein [bacterium]